MIKTNLTIFLSLFILSLSDAQTITNNRGNEILFGTVQKEELKQEPFAEWYDENQNEYTSTLSEADGQLLKDVRVKAFFGTWCGDTRYLLPKFLKAWESMGLGHQQLDLIALHVDSTLYKQGPNQETIGYDIHKVPTFVFEKNGKEIGRIVERTVFDLDTDIKLIAQQQPYKNRYQAVSLISEFIEDTPMDSLSSELVFQNAKNLIRRELSKPSELGIYAFVLKLQGEMKKAKFVFRLNKDFYEYDPWSISIYGKMLMDTGDLEGAQKEYYEALRIKKEDPLLIKRLSEINKKIEETSSD